MMEHTAETMITGGIEEMTEDQIAEVDRVLMILRGPRRGKREQQCGHGKGLPESVPDEENLEKFYSGKREKEAPLLKHGISLIGR